MGVDVHGDLDGAVAELGLHVLEVESVAGFHAAGHVVAEHVEGGASAYPAPHFGIAGTEGGGPYGGAVPSAEDVAFIMEGCAGFQLVFSLTMAIIQKLSAVVGRDRQVAVAFAGFGGGKDGGMRAAFLLVPAGDEGVADVERPACDGTCDSAFGKLVPFFIIHRERAIEWLANFAGQPEAVAGVR